MHKQKLPSEQIQGKHPRLGVALIIQGLLLIPWLPFAALSAMAYDQGKLWPGILVVGPFQAYPLLILVFVGIAALLKGSGKYAVASIVAWLAPIISLGSLLVFAFAGSIFMRLMQQHGS